jgi:hypothetical protein
MRKLLAVAFLVLAGLVALSEQSHRAEADAICYQIAAPTPIPTTGRPNLGICDSTGHLLTSSSGGAGPTPIPYPTNMAGVILVQPTNVPTLGVTVVNTPGVICVSGCANATPIAYPTTASGVLLVAPTALPTLSVTCVNCATPIPFPTLGVTVVNTPTVNAGTGFPTPLAIQPVSGTITVNTPAPAPTGASGLTATTTCDKTTATNCRVISSAGVADSAICTTGASCASVLAGGDVQTSSNVALWSLAQILGFNGSSLDRARTAGIGNAAASTGILATAPYCENLTALPTLTNATYGAAQCDTSGRLLISPTGLPTPLATQPVSAVDPCFGSAKTSINIFISASAQVISFSGSTSIYICGISLNYEASAGALWQLTAGTGSICSSGPITLYNFQTSSAAISLAAVNYGGAGAQIFQTVPSGTNVCIQLSGTLPMLTGVITYIQK